MNGSNKIAVLIDGDNASPKKIDLVFEELNTIGEIIIKRVYGDFSRQNLHSWKNVANKHGIKPIHGFNHTKGKNSTDISLIIDAMDIIYKFDFDILCIVSSDCDFTNLINRAKQGGKYTIGVGKQNSCNPYREACDKFIEEESLEKARKSIENIVANSAESDKPNELKIEAPKLPGLKIIGKINLNGISK